MTLAAFALVGCNFESVTGVKPRDLGTRDLAIAPDDLGPIDPGPPLDLAVAPGPFCAETVVENKVTPFPIDVIWVIDNSASMTEEIPGIEDQINSRFANLLNKSGIDYRAIFFTAHGSRANNEICVAPPLSQNACLPPGAMAANAPPRYFHYQQPILSTDALQLLLDDYRKPDPWLLAPNGWSSYLRAGAVKHFIVATDDKARVPAATFDAQLLALDPAQFGTAQKRNYHWHSIVGMSQNNPPARPWGPKDPIQNARCGNTVLSDGQTYQELAIFTGGLRLSICQAGDLEQFLARLVEIASIEGTSVFTCELPIPKAPPGQQLDPGTLMVEYTPSFPDGVPWYLTEVQGPPRCNGFSFYRNGNRVILCPDTCARITRDRGAIVRVLVGCI